jgi:hypothetical protein
LRSWGPFVAIYGQAYRDLSCKAGAQDGLRRGVVGATYLLPSVLALLGGLLSGEFRAAGRVQWCQVVLHDLPQERRRNLPVFVAQYVPDRCNFRPWDGRLSGLHGVGQSPAGLRHDLNPALNDPLPFPILLELPKRRGACLFADVFNRLDDVCQVGGDG